VHDSTINTLKKAPTDFRDMRMVELDTGKVTQLKIVDGKKKLVLKKAGADWSVAKSSQKVPDDFVLDAQLVSRRLSTLANTRGIAVAKKKVGAAGLIRAKGTVTATLDDGKKVVFKFGKTFKHEDRDSVYAMGNMDDAIYVANIYIRNNLLGMLDTFKKVAPAPSAGGGFGAIDPSALAKLPPDVRKSLEQQMHQKAQQDALLKRIQAQSHK